ncbi:hypothetical protein [Serratia phage vB_SspM_LC53]|nr:hypothetical protein [Serratia phage vB_SspM_LC53]
MSEFFKEGVWYTLNKSDKEDFICCAPGVNKAIAEYIGTKPFEVQLGSENDVVKIRIQGEIEFIDRITAIPEFTSSSYGKFWFYYDTEEEFKYFTEDGAVVEEHDYIIVVNETTESSYEHSDRRIVGIPAPTMFNKHSAENFAKEFLEKSSDPNASVEIFRLQSTAKVVKEIKFS